MAGACAVAHRLVGEDVEAAARVERRVPGHVAEGRQQQAARPLADRVDQGRAEAQLHGRHLPSEVSANITRGSRTSQPKTEKELALKALKKIFSKARGILERGERRHRVQRAKLREGLSSTDAEEALHHGRDTQIVGLLLSFIARLLDNGGPRKSLLAPSSIEAYFSAIAEEFITQAWEFDFESASSEELRDLFDAVSKKVSPKCSEFLLKLFCNHLRDEMSIPHFSSRWFSPREPVRIRSGLALPNHVSKAIAELNRNKSCTTSFQKPEERNLSNETTGIISLPKSKQSLFV